MKRILALPLASRRLNRSRDEVAEYLNAKPRVVPELVGDPDG